MPPYEDVVRPFIVDGTKEFTDVWNFESVRPYRGKHPAEKPIDLLGHAISATTYQGDIVLDCFAGSGSTAFAAVGLGRLAVSMEIDHRLTTRIANDLEAMDAVPDVEKIDITGTKPSRRRRKRGVQLSYACEAGITSPKVTL
jgi:site-specific DNA-methyltransferase (adenine-specific)